MDKIDFIDKFYAKYMREPQAYTEIRNYFLANDYDYLILWADDLMATADDFFYLLMDIYNKHYEVIGGVCQIDNTVYKDYMAISIPPYRPNMEFRRFEKFDDFYYIDGELLPKYKKNPIIKVKWQGFPLTCINRKVIEDIPFRQTGPQGMQTDDAFCWDCIQDEVPMFTDLRIRMNHLRQNENGYRLISWKGKEPYTKIVKAAKPIHMLSL